MSCCKSFPVLILRVLASFINSNYKPLSEKTRTTYLLDGNNKDRDHSWTYLFDGQRNRGYRIAKGFICRCHYLHLPLIVEVTRQMD